MMIKRKKFKKMVRPNIVPILDAVFIFIFFLLMSAQFIKIYEIGSDAPSVKLTDSKKEDKPPLNLTLDITKKEIQVKTGMQGTVVETIKRNEDESYDLEKLNRTLASIKVANLDETSVILRPKEDVPYAELVKIMDSARELPKDQAPIKVKNKSGVEAETKKMFDQIIFETII